MATYKLDYAGAEINNRLKAVDKLTNMTTNGTKTSFSGDLEVADNLIVSTGVLGHNKNDGTLCYLKLPSEGTSTTPAIIATQDYVTKAISDALNEIDALLKEI